MIEELTAELQDAVSWIDQEYKNVRLPRDEVNVLIAVGCYDLAIEHQAAMLLLCKSNLYGTMFATQRLLFEALLRGLWVQYCASPSDIKQFTEGHGPRKLLSMTSAIEKKLGDELLPLESYRKRLEGHLHDFTHTGFQHVARRHRPGEVRSNYSERDICVAINLAALLGLQAAARMAVVAGDDKLVAATHAKMVSYAKRYFVLKVESLSEK